MRKLIIIMWIYTHVLSGILCQNQTLDGANNSLSTKRSSPDAYMASILDSYTANNKAIFNILDKAAPNEGSMLKMPTSVPLTNMSKTSWTIPQPDNNTSQGTNNTLFTGSGEAVSDLSPKTQNEATIRNNSVDSSVIIPIVPSITGVVNNVLKAKDNEEQIKVTGIYIPLEKLSRKKRQSQNRTPQANDLLRNRVLLLTNQGSNGTLNQRLDGRVIMLMKKPNETSQWSNATMRIKSRDSIYDIVNANNGNNQISEVTRSLPAIQRISDLNNIELPLTPSEFTHINNSSINASRNISNNQTNSVLRVNGRQSANLQVSGRANPRNMTTANRLEGVSRQNLRTQNRQSSRQQSNRQPNRQLVSLRHSLNNGRPVTRRTQNRMNLNRSVHSNTQPSRQTTTNSRTRTRRPVQPRLTVQQPVNSRRISSQPSSSRTSSRRRITRPLVRAVSSQTLRQQSQRNRASQPRQRTNTIRRQPRRQIVRRRRPSPPDPFTRRFAAGFQRGSNLLHQPPLDFTGFDGTVRENAGFNGLPPNELRLPMPTLTQTPRLFGGLTLPGFGFGPTII